MDELRAISTFVLAAEMGSFNKAAEAQNTTPQAVSKTIRQLEQHLGVRLFHRTTRSSTLTEEGERLLESVKPSLDGLVCALGKARKAANEDEGVIRIAGAGAVVRKILIPLLAEFQQRFPLIQVELIASDGFSDIVAERIDVGFRAGGAPDLQVVGRRLFPIQLVVCATPEYLAQHGKPRKLDDLLQHRCIGYRRPGTGRTVPWEFDVDGDIVNQHMNAVLCCSDTESETLSTLAGIGIGQIDSINSAPLLRSGQLVPLLVDKVSERMGLYLYYAQRRNMPSRIRRFIDFASEHLLGSQEFSLPRKELALLARRGLTTKG